MMTFLDTSYLLALVLANDEHHERAVGWQRAVSGQLLTSEYVLIEFADALTHGPLRSVAMGTIGLLRQSPSIQIVTASTTLLDEGLKLFESRADKTWGLTDCISFVLMRQSAIQSALTSDRHFEQAGFQALLRSDPPSK